LSPNSLIAIAITQVVAVVVAAAIALTPITHLPPWSLPPSFASLLDHPLPTVNTVFWLVVAFFK
jgi:hypothetical protein